MKIPLLFLAAVLTTACTGGEMLSATNNHQKPANELLDKTAQIGSATMYLCKDNKEVKVVRTSKKNKQAKKVRVVNVTLGDITQRLTQVVSESGKKYSNIRWHWYEKSDVGTLTNSMGQILAEQCVKQKSTG